MSGQAETHRVMSLGARLQHGLFIVGLGLAYLSGAFLPTARGAGGGILGRVGMDPTRLLPVHLYLGSLCAAVVAFHLLYLGVRGYVESIPLRRFPLALRRGDLRLLWRRALNVAAGRPVEPARHTPFRRVWYWAALGTALVLVGSGGAVAHWDLLDMKLVSRFLGGLAAVHRGTGLLLVIVALWHAYEAVGGGRRLWALRLALGGRVSEERLREWYPDEYLRLRERKKRGREWIEAEREKIVDRERKQEREAVEEHLELGNDLARQGRFIDAAGEYRTALEIFPFYSQAQYNLALVLERAGKPAEALAEYQRFMEVDPFHPLADRVREAIRRLGG